jgi:hypothetical protein
MATSGTSSFRGHHARSVHLDFDPGRWAYTVPAEGGRLATDEEVRALMRATPSDSGYGWTDDGMSPYFPGIPCSPCGRFVGRDGSIEVEHREMSSEIASVDGTCARCLTNDTTEAAA